MAFYHVALIRDPHNRTSLGVVMLIVSVVYFLIAVFVFCRIVVLPWLDARQQSKAEALVRRELLCLEEPDLTRRYNFLQKVLAEKAALFGWDSYQTCLTLSHLHACNKEAAHNRMFALQVLRNVLSSIAKGDEPWSSDPLMEMFSFKGVLLSPPEISALGAVLRFKKGEKDPKEEWRSSKRTLRPSQKMRCGYLHKQ